MSWYGRQDCGICNIYYVTLEFFFNIMLYHLFCYVANHIHFDNIFCHFHITNNTTHNMVILNRRRTPTSQTKMRRSYLKYSLHLSHWHVLSVIGSENHTFLLYYSLCKLDGSSQQTQTPPTCYTLSCPTVLRKSTNESHKTTVKYSKYTQT